MKPREAKRRKSRRSIDPRSKSQLLEEIQRLKAENVRLLDIVARARAALKAQKNAPPRPL
jgi:hypothetical protein